MPGVVHPVNSSSRVNAEAVAMAHWQARAQVFAVAAWVAVQPAHDLGLGTAERELWSLQGRSASFYLPCYLHLLRFVERIYNRHLTPENAMYSAAATRSRLGALSRLVISYRCKCL